MHENLSDLRIDYADEPFGSAAAGKDPMGCFAAWFDDAMRRSTVVEANAVSLATGAADGTPSVRMVLLKHVDPARAAFAVYSNLDARKAREAAASGRAALCWWWPGDPARQVRVVGRVESVDRERAQAYFATRPLAARVGAAASEQSRAISSRAELDERIGAVDPSTLELPDRWGGIWIVADEIELWQGRRGRVHDRITFLRVDETGSPLSGAGVDAAGGEQRLREAGTMVTDPHGTRWLRARLAP
jgi:pyridoxamine 5'-phosphate oxidase